MCHDDAWTQVAAGQHGRGAMEGDDRLPGCSDCHGAHNIASSSDPESPTHPFNLAAMCGACHKNGGKAQGEEPSISDPYERFEKGVHGRALAESNEMAASCNSCHDSHKILPNSDPQSKIYITNISATCGACHSDVTEVYDESIHGVALARGEFDSPSCVSCHGEHEILSPSDTEAPTNASNLSEETCSPCHGLLRLNEKYGLLPTTVSSYRNSYHGLASLGGSKVAANCASCHGVHAIFADTDPRSSIHASNLQETCGGCHPNATQAFAESYVHATPASSGDRAAGIIRIIYIWLIVVVIGGMFVHNFIIWFAYVRAKLRAQRMEKTVQRFDRAWIVQHVLTFVSFTILVITGFALKFPEAGWVRVLSYIGLTESLRGDIHRFAAVILIAAGLLHIYYILFAKSWRGELKSLVPNVQDAFLFLKNMKYYLGLSKERPQFDRYGYVEKAEYWALIWGTAVMAITGFVLWFPTWATRIFPAWIVKVSETIHYYEAWLATLAILIYHFFFTVFHPEDYPINLAGHTGKISEEEARERFPKWVEKLDLEASKEETD